MATAGSDGQAPCRSVRLTGPVHPRSLRPARGPAAVPGPPRPRRRGPGRDCRSPAPVATPRATAASRQRAPLLGRSLRRSLCRVRCKRLRARHVARDRRARLPRVRRPDAAHRLHRRADRRPADPRPPRPSMRRPPVVKVFPCSQSCVGPWPVSRSRGGPFPSDPVRCGPHSVGHSVRRFRGPRLRSARGTHLPLYACC